jgi:4-diphosphocytidyl-2-C-methyl-D-erythritol kinase
MMLERCAYGKLNLTLDVLGLRPDGYHEMDMLMQKVSLYDTVTVETDTGEPWSLTCAPGDLPCGPDNLAWKAARAFYDATGCPDTGLRISIEKRIPSQAGMAGGSSDAAAVLHLLNALHGDPLPLATLCRVAEAVGSDVPYCVLGGTARAQGRGEVLTRLPAMPHGWFVLCKPDFSISTPALFRAIDGQTIFHRPDTEAAMSALETGDLRCLAAQMCNVFEPVVLDLYPHVAAVRQTMLDHGALASLMTGTGSVFYGLFDDLERAKQAASALKPSYPETFLAEPV